MIIVVPQGAEYKAVCRGLSRITTAKPSVIAIPMGSKSLYTYLENCQVNQQWNPETPVLLMGLCGSLLPGYKVGDIVLYSECVYQDQVQKCDRAFTQELYSHLQNRVSLVKGLTSDRVICSEEEKRQLSETSQASVVDMEGFAAYSFFNQANIPVAMLRVVSDDCEHDIPDLTSAISSDGSLQSLPLAISMIRQPIAATRLIKGSLRSLKVLSEVTTLIANYNRR